MPTKKVPKAEDKKQQVNEQREERNRAIENALSMIDRKYGKGTIFKYGEGVEVKNVEVFSSGSISLDNITGVGGIPRGRIIEIYGPESSGKTTLALHVVAEAQKQGCAVAFIDAEHALDFKYAKALGVDTDEVIISQPDHGEQGLDVAEQMALAGVELIVVDSVAALVPKAEIEGEFGEAQMGLHARLMSQAMRKLAGIIQKKGSTLIFINQIREKIGVIWGSPETTTGGRALKFYASMRIDIRRTGSIKDGENIVGNRTKVKIAKNKVAPPFRVTEFDIRYGEGIDRLADLIEVATKLEIIQKSGTWYSYGEERLGQGAAAAKSFLEANPQYIEGIEDRINDIWHGEDLPEEVEDGD